MKNQKWQEKCREKIVDPKQLPELVQRLRNQDKTIATLNGSFDLLHAGHLHVIMEAKNQADVLIMALNTDASIKQYKSTKRPIILLENRLKMIAALQCVDYVTWFEETTPLKILDCIKPDIHVNGSEYGDNCIEAPLVKKNGGKVHIVRLIDGLSTTKIIEKINTCV